jgi:hypothetical protein
MKILKDIVEDYDYYLGKIFGDTSGLVVPWTLEECYKYNKTYKIGNGKFYIPLMVGSTYGSPVEYDFCNYSGYYKLPLTAFIIEGVEKVIISQEVKNFVLRKEVKKFELGKEPFKTGWPPEPLKMEMETDDEEPEVKPEVKRATKYMLKRVVKTDYGILHLDDNLLYLDDKHIKVDDDRFLLSNDLATVDNNDIVNNDITTEMLDVLLGEEAERNDLKYKRIYTAGELIYSICNQVKGKKVYDTLVSKMVSGKWPIDKHDYHGVCETVGRKSLKDTMSCLTKVSIPSRKDAYAVDMRMLHQSHKGVYCCVETPESTKIGITKHFALDVRLEIGTGRLIAGESIFGFSATTNPLKNHNQATRSMFQANMGKQAMELAAPKHNAKYLKYGSKAHVNTPLGEQLPINGVMVNCAIASYLGYNMEDAIVINKNSTWMFENVRYDVIVFKESIGKFVIPIDNDGIRRGIVRSKEYIATYWEGGLRYLKNSFDWDINVCKVEILGNDIEHRIFKIHTKRTQQLMVGDKLTSRHGQKGVISKIVDPENLFYTMVDGQKVYPDIIINPHAIPSRMTVGQLLEMTMGKEKDIIYRLDIASGKVVPYSERKMFKGGYNTFYYNDNALENKIFCGPIYYHLLRHQVIEKSYSLGETKKFNRVSGQSVKGKAIDGAFRLGELDKDCLVAHNAWEIIQEKFGLDSDQRDLRAVPESFRSFQYLLYALHINLEFKGGKACVSVLDDETIEKMFDVDKFRIATAFDSCMGSSNNIKCSICPPSTCRGHCGIIHKSYFHPEFSKEFPYFCKYIVVPPNYIRASDMFYTSYGLGDLSGLYNKLITKYDEQLFEDILKKLRTKINAKEGFIRNILMGKNSSYCGRSVIIPNPNLDVDTIQVPQSFLDNFNHNICLFIRHPTLSKTSVMAVKMKTSNLLTISMNPKLCKAYNADFDGDEMNVFRITTGKYEAMLPSKVCPELLGPILDERVAAILNCSLHDLTFKIGLTFGLRECEDEEHIIVKHRIKGSAVNVKQMSQTIGALYLNDKLLINIASSYIAGTTDDEFFLQCMSGRDQVISKVLRIQETGYALRKLVKFLE